MRYNIHPNDNLVIFVVIFKSKNVSNDAASRYAYMNEIGVEKFTRGQMQHTVMIALIV
ncbi:MAG: hypothetical protein MJZ29_02825 [Bacteroidaceae bacterium]|nr:hypothetical protein [Bacteroidaceae bacterium]